MKYNESEVKKLYLENREAAHQRLACLPVAEGREPNTTGLNGWVYEQTIRYCLCQELKALGLSPHVEEQVPLDGRAKIDLLVGKVVVEIKALGSFGDDAAKYGRYGAKVKEKGWVYFYLTGSETYNPYHLATESAFGRDRAFFLDTDGEWARFVRGVIKSNEERP